MKKAILVSAAILLGLVAFGVVLVVLKLDSIVRQGIETVGSDLAQAPVRLASVKILPLSGRAQLAGLFVGNPAGYKTESAIRVGHVDMALKLASVFSDTLEIEFVRVHEPEITVEGGLKNNNLTALLANVQGSPSPTDGATPAPQPTASEKRFRVQEVTVTGGQANLALSPLGGKAARIPLPELRLANVGTGGAGVTAAELTAQILSPLLGSVMQVAGAAEVIGQGVSDASKAAQDAVKGVTSEAGKAVKGVSDLLRKKP
jgi:hypothetical protein